MYKVFLPMYLHFSRPNFGSFFIKFHLCCCPSFSATPRRHAFYCGVRMLFVHAHFTENSIFMKINSDNYRNAGLRSHHWFSMFIILSASISASICSSIFDGNMAPKMVQKISRESIRFATFKCLNNSNQWTHRTFIFS